MTNTEIRAPAEIAPGDTPLHWTNPDLYVPTPEQCAECLREVLRNYALGDTTLTIQ